MRGMENITPPTSPPCASAWDGSEALAEVVTIYFKQKTGIYKVQPHAKHSSGASAEFGEPTPISIANFRAEIGPAVLENLEKYNRQVFDESKALRFSDSEHKAFIKEHLCVDISRPKLGGVQVRPCYRTRGGYAGFNQEFLLKDQEIMDKLPDVLLEAFNFAAGPAERTDL